MGKCEKRTGSYVGSELGAIFFRRFFCFVQDFRDLAINQRLWVVHWVGPILRYLARPVIEQAEFTHGGFLTFRVDFFTFEYIIKGSIQALRLFVRHNVRPCDM